jgi:hypothetical protein
MARSKIIDTRNDLNRDSGSVLWSFVLGEQLEFPINLTYITDVRDYEIEAVVIEADNVEQQSSRPVSVKSGGIHTTLTTRKPAYLGEWNSAAAYSKGESVKYENVTYELSEGLARINSTPPPDDPLWIETGLNTIYVQFETSLGSDWSVQPVVNSPVYGFFEIRVTEPLVSGRFQQTWKPVRGMVELLFSPTDIVA